MKIILCDKKALDAKKSYGEITGLLDEDSRAGIERYKFEEGRLTALVRELALRYVFYKTFGEGEITISKNEFGKPFVLRAGKEGRGICQKDEGGFEFNISHAGDLVCIIYGQERAGIDVEKDSRVKDTDLLNRFLYEHERARVEAAEDKQKEFCRIWTFREALCKEEGLGLSLFEREGEDKEELIRIDYEKNMVDLKGRRLFFYEYPCPGYHLTCCLGKKDKRPELIWTDMQMWEEMKNVFSRIRISRI